MKKILIIIALTSLTAQPLNAMEPSAPTSYNLPGLVYYLFNSFIATQPQRKTERRIFGMNTIEQCPDHITLLNKDEPITDELLLELNPEWKSVKASSSETKNRIHRRALSNILKGQAAKTLIALAICVGANPNYAKDDGFTALNHSLDESDYELTHYLLSKKADPNQEGRFMRLPIQFAKTPQIAALLLAFGAEISPKLFGTFANSNYPPHMVEFFVAEGALLIPDAEGMTALHHITCRVADIHDDEEKKIQKIHALLKAGCDYTLQDHYGNTALHSIKVLKSTKICQIFIDHHFNSHYARFLTLLLCLKKNPHIPYPSKDIRTIFFHLLVQQPLYDLLNTKNSKGKTAYDIWPINELNPKTCIHESFLRLRQKNQDSIHKLEEIDV